MRTHLYLLLDQSGSMTGRAHEVVSHVNEYLDDFRDKADTLVTILLFGGNTLRLWERETPIQLARPMRDDDFKPDGSTPLNDAIGRVIDMGKVFSDDNKLVVIVSDGEENSSKRYPGTPNVDLKRRVEHLGTSRWAFIYLGENQKAEVSIDAFGGLASNSANVKGMDDAFNKARMATSNYYMAAGASASLESLMDDEQVLKNIAEAKSSKH